LLVKDAEPFASVKVLVKELDDVLLRDVGDRIKNCGKYVKAKITVAPFIETWYKVRAVYKADRLLKIVI